MLIRQRTTREVSPELELEPIPGPGPLAAVRPLKHPEKARAQSDAKDRSEPGFPPPLSLINEVGAQEDGRSPLPYAELWNSSVRHVKVDPTVSSHIAESGIRRGTPHTGPAPLVFCPLSLLPLDRSSGQLPPNFLSARPFGLPFAAEAFAGQTLCDLPWRSMNWCRTVAYGLKAPGNL
ncbi:hypothetical protein R1flu_003905 [Riccia fluitans]|uniref:Uncharacterized protein n=1 Tax=Riccia fluitans TaxID=41844 RepID=A0ABD1YAH7_9MARC